MASERNNDRHSREVRLPYVTKLSNPALVRTIRQLMVAHAAWRLTHMDEDPLTALLLHSALEEAAKRNITIQHPEKL